MTRLIREGEEHFLIQKAPRERGTPQERRHFNFVHSLMFCPFTRSTVGIEAAHIRINTGIAHKPNWRHVLPIRADIHKSQDALGQKWWGKAGFKVGTDNDPRNWAVRLSEVTGNAAEAEALLWDMAERVNIPFIAACMAKYNLS
mgnify:CR=1 FL=1